MKKLSLYHPVHPFHLNQGFGANPDYYAKFHDRFGKPYKGHNGLDLMAKHGQPVYAPIAGLAMYTKDAHGGQSVIIRTDDLYEYGNGQCWFSVLCGHLVGDSEGAYPPPIKMNLNQTPVSAGDLIGYADNTGAPYESSGDHLHFAITPVDENGRATMPGNGFNGCVDPTPYLNGKYAVDIQIGLLKQLLDLSTKLLSYLKGK